MPVTTVRRFIAEEFLPDVPEAEIEPGLDLVESGVIDSLGLLKVIAWLESHFDIAIDVAEMVPENFSSVEAICGFLDRVRGAPAGSVAA